MSGAPGFRVDIMGHLLKHVETLADVHPLLKGVRNNS